MVFCVFVTCYIKEGCVEKFIEACRRDHEGSRTEPDNLRFDVLQSPEDKHTFHLYEVYKDEEANNTHQKMPHFAKFQEEVKDLMAKPFVVSIGNSVFPNPYN